MMEDLFHDYGHIDFDDDDGFLDMDALAAAEQLSIGAKALADDGSIADLAALSADSFASDTLPSLSVMDCSSNGANDGSGDGKESTGRWTREEHLLFIKGLEMYGKGWKKIAGLIKTRTVVQIRTHAQKYFLKLAKARQNGGGDMHSGSLSLDGKSFTDGMRKKKLRRRRRHDKPIAVAPPLQPFVKVRKEGSDAPEPVDVDKGLYHFLSAPMGTISTTPSVLQLPNIEGEEMQGSADVSPHSTEASIAGPEVKIEEAKSMLPPSVSCKSVASLPAPASMRSCNSLTSFSGVAMVERLRLNSSERSLPEWYAKGKNVASLLKEAETLDWGVQLTDEEKRSSKVDGAVKEEGSPTTVTADLSKEGSREGDAKSKCKEEVVADADSAVDKPKVVEEVASERQVGSKASFSTISTEQERVIEGDKMVIDKGTCSPTSMEKRNDDEHSAKKMAFEAEAGGSSTPIAETALGKMANNLVTTSPDNGRGQGSDSDQDELGGIVF